MENRILNYHKTFIFPIFGKGLIFDNISRFSDSNYVVKLGQLHIKKRSGDAIMFSNWTTSLEETISLISKSITFLHWHFSSANGLHKLEPYD